MFLKREYYPTTTCLRCYGNTASWKGREPDQHKKTAQAFERFFCGRNRLRNQNLFSVSRFYR
ncbi:hypothetical protein AL479_22745 [Citrobacter amalonaticus]|nr:hypothetical protein AL479_22745 [Citrobacter amalonaticus]